MTVDMPSVKDEKEATTLMLHHLMIAASYFENTHDDNGLYAKNQILEANIFDGVKNAVAAFVDELCSAYKEVSDA